MGYMLLPINHSQAVVGSDISKVKRLWVIGDFCRRIALAEQISPLSEHSPDISRCRVRQIHCQERWSSFR
jgi:hypothetical protein